MCLLWLPWFCDCRSDRGLSKRRRNYVGMLGSYVNWEPQAKDVDATGAANLLVTFRAHMADSNRAWVSEERSMSSSSSRSRPRWPTKRVQLDQ